MKKKDNNMKSQTWDRKNEVIQKVLGIKENLKSKLTY